MGTLHKGFVMATWLVLPAALYPEMARSDQAASTRLLKALPQVDLIPEKWTKYREHLVSAEVKQGRDPFVSFDQP